MFSIGESSQCACLLTVLLVHGIQAQQGMVEKVLPGKKTVEGLADAAATNAPTGPLKVSMLLHHIMSFPA